MLRKQSSTPKLSWILVIICPPSGECPTKKVIVSAGPSLAKKNRQETARRFSSDGREHTRNGVGMQLMRHPSSASTPSRLSARWPPSYLIIRNQPTHLFVGETLDFSKCSCLNHRT
jgi:hypothetical protein